MTGEDIQARRDYHRSEAERARGLAEEMMQRAEEHDAKVRAYDFVLQDLGLVTVKVVGAKREDPAVPEEAGASGSFMDWVRKAIGPQKPVFEMLDVRRTLDEIAPGVLDGMSDRNALNKALNRMAESKEIYNIRKGQGRRPALYSKKDPRLSVVALGRFANLGADDFRPEEEVNEEDRQVSGQDPISG